MTNDKLLCECYRIVYGYKTNWNCDILFPCIKLFICFSEQDVLPWSYHVTINTPIVRAMDSLAFVSTTMWYTMIKRTTQSSLRGTKFVVNINPVTPVVLFPVIYRVRDCDLVDPRDLNLALSSTGHWSFWLWVLSRFRMTTIDSSLNRKRKLSLSIGLSYINLISCTQCM